MEDMLTYLRAQLGPADTDLERAMRQTHQERHRFTPEMAMGLGWSRRTVVGRTLISHGGGTAGFRTMIGFDPEKQVGFVMLTNSGGFEDDIGADFLLRGPPLAIREVAINRSVVAPYVGEYELQPGRSAFVRLENDGTMTLRVPGNVRFRMYAESDSTFFIKRAPWRVRFTRDGAGAVTAMSVDMEGTVRTARRISDRAPTPAEQKAEQKAAVRDLPLTAEEMARYEGTYTLQLGPQTLDIRVFVQDGRLMSQATGQSAFGLRAQGDHAFIPTFSDEVRLVFTVENGRATGVTLHQDGREATGTRKP
jgi:hypothetical protein